MAKSGNQNFWSGRARVLLDALAFFENDRRNIDEGRAGIVPPNLDNPQVIMSDRDRQEVGQPHGRAKALEMLVMHPGVSLHGEEGEEPSFLLNLLAHKIPHPDL